MSIASGKDTDSEADTRAALPAAATDAVDLRLDDFICFAIYSAAHAVNRVYKPVLDELGLTYPQYLAMVLLWEEDGRTVGELGAQLRLESSTLTPLLKRLEAAGLLRRVRDKADERQVRLYLTKNGQTLRERASAMVERLSSASGRDASELHRLRREISALRDTLEANTAGSLACPATS